MTKTELFERVAAAVCRKPHDVMPDECYASFGEQHSLCRAYGRCRLYEKTAAQLRYVVAPSTKNVFLKACPGSGKTEVVGLKAAYEIQKWKQRVGGLAVLTFTRNAANVISTRVSQFVGNRGLAFPHFVGTFDSWLHGYIANPFAHDLTGYKGKDGDWTIRIIDEQCVHPFLRNYQTKYRYDNYGHVRAHHFYVDDDDDGDRVFVRQQKGGKHSEMPLKAWGLGDFRETKRKFWEAGFATYRDMETLCLRLLDDDSLHLTGLVKKRFPFIIVDECQDLSPVQLGILERLLEAGANVHLVGDLNQAIFEFRQTYPEAVQEYVEGHKFVTKPLAHNFRSVQPIVDLCGRLVGQGEVVGREPGDSEPACVTFEYSGESPCFLVANFVRYLTKRGIPMERAAVLARGKALVAQLRPGTGSRLNVNQRLPTAIKLWQAESLPAMDDALGCMGGFVVNKFFSKRSSDSRHHDCPEDVAKPLTWRLFLAKLLDACANDSEIADLSQTWKNWACTVRKAFRSRLLSCADLLPGLSNEDRQELPHLDGNTFRVPAGMGEKSVEHTLDVRAPAESPSIRITTIHQVKGETFEAVLVVSAQRTGQGGHWKEWIKDPASENARFAYVASSRPRTLLVWAVPELAAEERKTLESMGFRCIGEDPSAE